MVYELGPTPIDPRLSRKYLSLLKKGRDFRVINDRGIFAAKVNVTDPQRDSRYTMQTEQLYWHRDIVGLSREDISLLFVQGSKIRFLTLDQRSGYLPFRGFRRVNYAESGPKQAVRVGDRVVLFTPEEIAKDLPRLLESMKVNPMTDRWPLEPRIAVPGRLQGRKVDVVAFSFRPLSGNLHLVSRIHEAIVLDGNTLLRHEMVQFTP